MRTLLFLTVVPSLILVGQSCAQVPAHVAIEATSLVLDEARVTRAGLGGLAVSAENVGVRAGGGGDVLIGTRLGGLNVAAWLDLVRRERAVERETTQRIVVLSGSSASILTQRTVTGLFGQSASAGPELWVEPSVRDDGQILLRVYSAVGDVELGAFGSIRQDIAVEGSTEIVVPSGTSVVIASSSIAEGTTDRGLLERGGRTLSRQAWIVVTPRAVTDAGDAFPLPAGIPDEWLRQ